MGPTKEFNHAVQAEQFKLELNQNLPHAGITCQFKLELNQNPGASLHGIAPAQKQWKQSKTMNKQWIENNEKTMTTKYKNHWKTMNHKRGPWVAKCQYSLGNIDI